MNIDPIEMKNGYTWFFGAGLFAVLLSIGLFFTDEMLENSSKERDLGQTLFELRSAQSSFTSGSVDERLQHDNYTERHK